MAFYKLFIKPEGVSEGSEVSWVVYTVVTTAISAVLIIALLLSVIFGGESPTPLLYFVVSAILTALMCVYWYCFLKKDAEFLRCVNENNMGLVYNKYVMSLMISLAMVSLNWALYAPVFIIRLVPYLSNSDKKDTPVYMRIFKKIYKEELVENRLQK